ncbi:hypothetical protein ACP4OV_002395 [Aristida adscensionis]
MEVVLGALPSLLPKLAELLTNEYNLQKEVKGGIRYLQTELESMKAALEDISKIPADKLPNHDKIWARNVRELSYDIEDNIDTFMLQAKTGKQDNKHGLKKFMDRTISYLMLPKMRRKTALDIRDIRVRVKEVHELRRNYEVKQSTIDTPVKVDPRTLVRYEKITELVGINKARDEVIKILTEGNQVSKQQEKIVSIVGFGGLGKTTLANVVYQKLRAQFDCSAFVSVSQTPDTEKLLKDMFYQLAKQSSESINVIEEVRQFLKNKSERYFIIIDDIWDISYWHMIRFALPDDIDEYRIITTTRIFTVAEQIGGTYEMKPLSLENSKILMYRRIFGKEYEDKCPHEELVEVSNKILKKCAGVPLAIVTIASLLVSKGRNKLEWYDVCNSIGTGLEGTNAVENMRKVLSLSYYNMPSYLRTCLLYLSVFPEDYEISKDRLIWLWIAEGFIQPRKLKKRLFEIGESCFNELVNTSMILPAYYNDSGMIESCRVHDMVLDLICSLSSEENFVTIPHDIVHTSTQRTARRLSFQHEATYTKSMEHVRSVVVFQPVIDLMPALQKFRVLRVLELKGCDLSRGYSLKYLGNLLHLRYLGLSGTGITHLPEEVGNLQFLQILDVRSDISSLPVTIVHLTHLMCLRIHHGIRVPYGIGSLRSIEVLAELGIPYDCANIIEELGHLRELRVLDVIIDSEFDSLFEIVSNKFFDRSGSNKSLTECLNKLQKIESLSIFVKSGGCILDGWVVCPRHLRRLKLRGCWFSTLPPSMNPSLLQDLSYLGIKVTGLKQDDLVILGRLPALRYLDLFVEHKKLGIQGRFFIGARLFPYLVHCYLWEFGGPVVFQLGAMPRLTKLILWFLARKTSENNKGFDLGLENLPSLQRVDVTFGYQGASEEEVKEAEAAVRHTIELHPNHPTLDIAGYVELKTYVNEDGFMDSGTDEDEGDELGTDEDNLDSESGADEDEDLDVSLK